MPDIGEVLRGPFAARGWAAAFAPAHVLGEVRRGYDALRAEGLIEHPLLVEHLDSFDYAPEEMPQPESVAAVAVSAPAWRVTFHVHAVPMPVTIPPTYVRHREVKRTVLEAAEELLGPLGYRAVLAAVPEKATAARLGLARYGRNNIAYVRGLGSFAELAVLLSDAPAREVPGPGVAMMSRCETCSACVSACPTGAIGQDRFLLRAARCLVLYNEEPGRLPAWIHADAHDSLIGCMGCQRACPENAAVRDEVRDLVEFDDEETALLLGGAQPGDLSEETRAKVGMLGLTVGYETVVRNLGLLAGQ